MTLQLLCVYAGRVRETGVDEVETCPVPAQESFSDGTTSGRKGGTRRI